MAKPQLALDLGQMQSDLVAAAQILRASTRAKQRADQAYDEAVEAHERARIALNSGVQTLKAATNVPNLYAS